MNRLLQHRFLIRKNLISLVGLCLCFYFSYHALYGNRSVARLVDLTAQIEIMSKIHDDLKQDRQKIEQKVIHMRPGFLEKDLLEERIRAVLGYQNPQELVVLGN